MSVVEKKWIEAGQSKKFSREIVARTRIFWEALAHISSVCAFLVLLCASEAFAVTGWFDDSFRRPIEVTWDAEHASGSELCYVDFYTAGHGNPDGSDLRVSTDEARQVPCKILRVGPGDKISLVFSLVKGVKKYYVYFGNPKPTANKPGMDDVKIEAGLLMDMHEWTGLPVENFKQIEEAWNKAGPVIGRAMIDSPFYGINPFGTQERTISKITGSLFVPLEGEYNFSVFADDRGALYIDETPVVFAVIGPADVHNQGKLRLKRGRHTFLFYHVNAAGDGLFTVAWLRPDARGWEAIPRGAFGIFSRGTPGPLEELHKTLVADFTVGYAGECFYADGYSHRYKFAARLPKAMARATFEWDFGDGQTGSAPEIEHVYLVDGIYPVKLAVRIGINNDTQTSKLAVSRDWPHIEKPPSDEPSVQSKIVGTYDVARMPEDWLARATWLHERAGQQTWMLLAATRAATLAHHANADGAFAALAGASTAAIAKNDSDSALKLWAQVPATSDLEPRAAVAYARLLLWQTAEFNKAVEVLQPYAAGNDPAIRRLYANALILSQKAAEGKKILESLPVNEEPARRVAKSGALARTIEYYIAEKDWETGSQQWDHWQDQFPSDFLEGYSIMLKTKLMEIKGTGPAAARVAEAFATAVPTSSYAPQLLFRASKLLEPTDRTRSQTLIKLLKDRYPEDPLAQ